MKAQATFKVELLNNKILIDQACSLLHEVYIEQGNWQFSIDNPSNLRVDISNNKMILSDRFVDRAIWFGAFESNELVGCVRLLGVDENNRLEVENYPASASTCATIPDDEKKYCYEIQRLVTKKEFVGRGIVKHLIHACFKYCYEHQFHVLAFTNNGYLKSIFKKIDFPMKKESAFKYEPHDSSEVNFYIAYRSNEVREILEKLERIKNARKSNARTIFRALQIVEPILPTPFYWMDTDGVVLGINELCLKAIGTTREIIGKKPYEFYKREIADYILKHNAEVIRREEILSQEEWIEDITTKERKCFASIKAPLYDDEGTIIGIVGTSIEITAQKEAELLRIENERAQATLEEKEKFVLISRKFAHDIASPLTTIKLIAPAFKNAPEKNQKSFFNSIERLMQISDHLLATYRCAENEVIEEESKKAVHIFDEISQLVEEKRIQYQDKNIVFDIESCEASRDALVNLQLTQFRRAMSNLMNNSVDALRTSQSGQVKINLQTNCNYITLRIKDNGHGMTEEVREKILAGSKVTHGKEKGNGLGWQQVWDLINQNDATLSIDSKAEYGTLIEIVFPLSTKIDQGLK